MTGAARRDRAKATGGHSRIEKLLPFGRQAEKAIRGTSSSTNQLRISAVSMRDLNISTRA
jgi:hypothetical protein